MSSFNRSVVGSNGVPGAGSSSGGAAIAFPANRTGAKRYEPKAALYNLHSGNTAKWRKALAKARAGVKTARINNVGDSITFGQYATPGGFSAGHPARLRKMLDTRLGVAAGTGVIWPYGGTYKTDDTRVTYTSAVDVSGYGPFGKSCVSLTGAASISFAATGIDTFKVYYISQSGTGKTMGLAVDGGAVTNVNTGGGASNTAAVATISAGTAGSHTLTITAVASTIYIVGFEGVLSGNTGVITTACGYPGYSAYQLLTVPGDASPTSYQYLFNTLAPDLTIFGFGVNEYLGTRTPAQFLSDMQTLIPLAQATGDVLLLTTVPNQSLTVLGNSQYAYDQQLWTLADTMDVPVLDLSARWGTYAADTGVYANGTHPNNAGYFDIGSAEFDAVVSGG